ncbi:hypothetical protein D6789_03080 [Candidatus Woesearchaeota archaeon]|nr:MAG: hypothetical protein D6789_03080 [Candidatus Woesearchaeota archaeon]
MGLPTKQWKDKQLIEQAIADANRFGGFTLIEVSHGNNGHKRRSVMQQREYWHNYGVAREQFAYGIATARNNGYYPAGLDFFMRLDHLEEDVLERSLDELVKQQRRHLSEQKARQLRKFKRTSPYTLEDLMLRRRGVETVWNKRYLTHFGQATSTARGWLLEQYVQTLFTDRLTDGGIGFSIYHNLGIAKPETVNERPEVTSRDSDIVICAPMLDVLHVVKALRQEYAVRINRRWGKRVSHLLQKRGRQRR